MSTVHHTPASPHSFTADQAGPHAAAKCEAAIDAGLVRRFNGGDETSFIEIMHRHERKTFAKVLGMLHDRADAEEITQDTFLRAHRGLGRFRGDCSLATWLHHIATNLARNRYWYYVRRHRHATLSLDYPLTAHAGATFTELIASEAPDPTREAVNGEFSALIATCMERLSAERREILTLHNIHHYSYEAIAQALHIKVGTVKSRIARARENLRKLLAETCPEFAPGSPPSAWFETAHANGHLAA